ncbi:DUF167 domain-containing protein [Solwaraspora sp. WMMD791]|uniref:DUF167 domain-containing protein n=1 Tax=Solwaraspora sp. WMMD791 TaxID=3016086 RepID=UPI00249C0A49|nr:DUF167 domain-containing protein [Solwaraspora sp. WMMD791]WFE29382.1 DUF167 domain-containing protein [Solwaraspora sp. WMMD791]
MPSPPDRGGRRADRASTSLSIAVRVKPGSSRSRVGGSHPGPRGPALVIAVSAPAVDGRATEAARRALAAALDVPARRVTVHTGATSRDKIFAVAVADDADRLTARVTQLRDG